MISVFIVLFIVAAIFGIVYLGVTSRNRIRMALIEKGADASIFHTKPAGGRNTLPIILINLAALLFFLGLGVFGGAILSKHLDLSGEVTFLGTLFCFAGIGLFIGYVLTRKIIKESSPTKADNGPTT